ncbi:MBL fold metallo-hydrolase [Leisingera sp. SS27]|uniref:MBL fold metallo-hydrolase n=1 Tax=Leisingera sp. SS27 TaxID=2979462 RepID=UPI0023313FC7|nr:MBL fold metallo-hydrolase [Leisingera sp. SS27]MDC0657106.1 MBL fold metallo-hydrolase [Leisingera sp. SS27]
MKQKSRALLTAGILPLLGACASYEAKDKVQTMSSSVPSHHTANRGFRNPPGSPVREGSAGEMLGFILNQLLSSFKIPVPSDHVLGVEEFRRQLAQASNPSVTWLGHSAFIIRLGGKVILTDPFLGETAGPAGFGPKRFAAAPISGAELPKADVLLVSHNHYDHLDAPTIEAYPYKADIQVIVPLGLGAFFISRGYSKVIEQDWWDDWQSGSLRISALPAIHNSGRGLRDKNKTLWAGFGIYTGEGSIWFSGDTASGPVFDEIGRKAGPFDLALVAIGAYEPRKLMKGAHVTPEEAVDLVKRVGARSAIGMHWGTIALTPENPFEAPVKFRQAAETQGLGAENAVVVKIGETVNLSAGDLALPHL